MSSFVKRCFVVLSVVGLCAVATPAGATTTIGGTSPTSVEQATAWAQQRGATANFVALAPLYWSYATARGVRADIAFAQSALETNFGRFGGVISAEYRNPCGLKTTAGGANDDPNAHMRFLSWQQGVTACVDHLGLYAGAVGYPRADSPDPRHFVWLFATATTVEALSSQWASNSGYGADIVRLVGELDATTATAVPEPVVVLDVPTTTVPTTVPLTVTSSTVAPTMAVASEDPVVTVTPIRHRQRDVIVLLTVSVCALSAAIAVGVVGELRRRR